MPFKVFLISNSNIYSAGIWRINISDIMSYYWLSHPFSPFVSVDRFLYRPFIACLHHFNVCSQTCSFHTTTICLNGLMLNLSFLIELCIVKCGPKCNIVVVPCPKFSPHFEGERTLFLSLQMGHALLVQTHTIEWTLVWRKTEKPLQCVETLLYVIIIALIYTDDRESP